MPEGDTAYRAAFNLDRSLAGRIVDRFELRVPDYATASLVGERIHRVDSRGKHMLMRIGDCTVHSHFGMDGSWRLVPPRPSEAHRGIPADTPRGAAARARLGRPRLRSVRRGPTVAWPADHRIRAIIGTAAVIALGIDLARLELWPTAEEEERFGWLGPDLLDDDVDLDEAVRRVAADPGRPITAALLDQRNVAGLGNEYVTEMCFLRGVLPSRTVGECGDMGEWLELGHRLMLANRDRVERTFTGDLRNTGYVFGREGEPCRRCGTIIVAGTHASGSEQRGAELRQSTWCPHCQV